MTRALVTLLLVTAVAAPGLAEERPKEMPAADVSKWLAFFDRLVDTVVASSSKPCEQMAAQVNAVIDAHDDAVSIARKAYAQGRKLPQSAQNHMMTGVKKMVPAMQKCGQNDKVRAAFAKLDLTRQPAQARRR